MRTQPTCSGCGTPVSRGYRRCRPCAHKHSTWSAEQRARNAAYWTPARRQAQAEQTRRLAAGRRRPRPEPRPARRPIRGDAWTAADDELLVQLAGTMTLAELTDRINQRSRHVRTSTAVSARGGKLGVSLQAPGMTATGLTALFRSSPYTVNHWIKRGLITGKRAGTGRTSDWLFSDDDIRRFIRTYPLVYDRARITSPRWRAEAEVVWRVAGWITTSEAAAFLGLTIERLHYLFVRSGQLEVRRGRHPIRQWQCFVARSAVMELRQGVSA